MNIISNVNKDFHVFLLTPSSMLPLLLKDGQLVTYISTMVLYSILYYNFYPSSTSSPKESSSDEPRWDKIVVNLMVRCVVVKLCRQITHKLSKAQRLYVKFVSDSLEFTHQ